MNFKRDFMTLLNRNKTAPSEAKDSGSKAGEVSMKDGDHGTIFGVNRKIVIGTGILFVTIFVIAYIFASEAENQKKAAVQPNKIKQEIADPKTSDTGKLPGDYADLVAADKAAAKRNGGTVHSNGTDNTVVMNTPQQTSSSSTLPQVPYSQPYYLPSSASSLQGQQIPITQITPVTAENAKENPKDKFKAAIAFALGTSDPIEQADPATTSTGVAAANPIANFSYTDTNENGLQAGTVIPAILCSGINTDVGGQVIAQVAADTYDSLYGSNLLIPAGSRLLGSYEAGKASTEGRVSIVFTTLILPNGGTYSLQDSMIAVDGAGYAGIAGRVNNHTGRTLGAGVLSTALAAVAGVAGGNTTSSNSTNNNYSTGQLASQGAMSNLLNTASSLFQKDMNIQATVTVAPGYEFNVFIAKPISFQF